MQKRTSGSRLLRVQDFTRQKPDAVLVIGCSGTLSVLWQLLGNITPQGNQNEALPALAAACLTDEPVVLENLPAIADVGVMQRILRKLGAQIERGN